MFTSIDKAIVAVIMGAVYILNTATGIEIPFVSEDTLNTALGFLLPILTYIIPNKA